MICNESREAEGRLLVPIWYGMTDKTYQVTFRPTYQLCRGYTVEHRYLIFFEPRIIINAGHRGLVPQKAFRERVSLWRQDDRMPARSKCVGYNIGIPFTRQNEFLKGKYCDDMR